MDQQTQKLDKQLEAQFVGQYLPNWSKKAQKSRYKMSYVLTNLDMNKKNVMLSPFRQSAPKLDDSIFEESRNHGRVQSMSSASISKIDRYHQGFLAIPIDQQDPRDTSSPKKGAQGKGAAKNVQKYEYKELEDWWRSHKNSLKKEQKDLVPICYDDRTGWEIITNSMLSPKGGEGRQWWEMVEQFKKGQTNDNKQGYQYDIGVFPYIFKKVVKPVTKKKNKDLAANEAPSTQRTQNGDTLNNGESQLPSKHISMENSNVKIQETNSQPKSTLDNPMEQFKRRQSQRKQTSDFVPKYLPLKVNQMMAAEKSAQNQGSMRLTNGFAARSKTPLLLRQPKNIDVSKSQNGFKIQPMINSESSQLKSQVKIQNPQTQKQAVSKFLKPQGLLSHSQLKKIEDVSTPLAKNRKSTYLIGKDGVRNVSQLTSQDRAMSPKHNEYSENIEEYLNDNMGSMLVTNKQQTSIEKTYRQILSQSTNRSQTQTTRFSANNLPQSRNTGRINVQNFNMVSKPVTPFDSLANNTGFLPKNIRLNQDLVKTPDLLVHRNGRSINTQHHLQKEKLKIFRMLESNRLTSTSMSKRDQSQSKVSTNRDETKDNSEMRCLDDTSYEQQSVRRNQYYDHYFTALSQMGGVASSYEKNQQSTTEKLFQKDRLVQKQMSLFQNYGKKMRLSQNMNHGSFKDHLRGSL